MNPKQLLAAIAKIRSILDCIGLSGPDCKRINGGGSELNYGPGVTPKLAGYARSLFRQIAELRSKLRLYGYGSREPLPNPDNESGRFLYRYNRKIRQHMREQIGAQWAYYEPQTGYLDLHLHGTRKRRRVAIGTFNRCLDLENGCGLVISAELLHADKCGNVYRITYVPPNAPATLNEPRKGYATQLAGQSFGRIVGTLKSGVARNRAEFVAKFCDLAGL